MSCWDVGFIFHHVIAIRVGAMFQKFLKNKYNIKAPITAITVIIKKYICSRPFTGLRKSYDDGSLYMIFSFRVA